MPLLELTNDQIIELVRQLPAEQRRDVLMLLAERAVSGREERMEHAEAALTQLAAERGQEWKAMSEDEREAFANELIHEDRTACRS